MGGHSIICALAHVLRSQVNFKGQFPQSGVGSGIKFRSTHFQDTMTLLAILLPPQPKFIRESVFFPPVQTITSYIL